LNKLKTISQQNPLKMWLLSTTTGVRQTEANLLLSSKNPRKKSSPNLERARKMFYKKRLSSSHKSKMLLNLASRRRRTMTAHPVRRVPPPANPSKFK